MEPNGSQDQSSLPADVLEKLKNCFQKLFSCPHDPITRAFHHRIHYGAFTLSRPAEISPDADEQGKLELAG